MPADKLPSYKPSAYYFRKALQSAKTKKEAVEIGLQVVRELEAHKEFIRELGAWPPRKHILSTEAEDKGLKPKLRLLS